MFGLDLGLNLLNNWFAGERQEDSAHFGEIEGQKNRDWAREEAITTRAFNASEAQKTRDWEQMMSNTAMQRRVQDLISAGINPLLAYPGGGASSPTGATASSGIPGHSGAPSSGIASPQSFSLTAAMANASQAAVNEANVKRVEAETDRTKAEEAEIRARTPVHAVTIESMKQQIEESISRVGKILQETETSAATAQNIRQQTINLQEVVPQIRATVEQLKATTAKTWAEKGLTEAQITHLQQQISANLPRLEAALKDLEAQRLKITQPTLEMEHATTGHGFIGSLSATLRALNPFNNFFRSR